MPQKRKVYRPRSEISAARDSEIDTLKQGQNQSQPKASFSHFCQTALVSSESPWQAKGEQKKKHPTMVLKF